MSDKRAQRTLRVPTTTLSAIIDQAGVSHIDFMSIDVEGAELALLEGLDFKRHTPSWAVVETDNVARIADLFSPWMTLFSRLTHHDYLFRSSALAKIPELTAEAPMGKSA